MAFALAIPLFRPRDSSLPPPPPGSEPGVLEGFELASSATQIQQLPGDRDAVSAALQQIVDWLNAGLVVYMLDLEFLLAQFLWIAPDNHNGRELRQATRDGRLRSLAHIERNMRLVGVTPSETVFPLSDGTDAASWWRTANWMDRWLARNADIAPTKWGPLASGMDALGDAAVLCMSWKGMRADTDYIRAALREVQSETLPASDVPGELIRSATQRESVRESLLQAARAVREDGRMHPVYERQRLSRLMASNPAYHAFSGETTPSSRAVVIPDEGEHLVSMDVSMAELFVAAVLWKRRLRGPKAGNLLADLLDPELDIHQIAGETLLEEAGNPPHNKAMVRPAGKRLIFSLYNLAGADSISGDVGGMLDVQLPIEAVERTRKRMAVRYPFEEWRTFNKRQAFELRIPRIETLSGRWLHLPTRSGQKKPSPARAASYQTQTSYADMHQTGILAVVENAVRLQAWPIATLFDELVLTVKDPAVMPEVADLYLQAVREVSGEAGLRIKWTVWNGPWGVR